MLLGIQYYRAPFPEERHWKEDFQRIRDAGFDAVQLWLIWGWIEARPGEYDFSDYDRLFDLAQEYSLKVVASTIAEIQPMWIFREEPGSEMVDVQGKKVVSSLRCECNFGLTPGGCTDHPGVKRRMLDFIAECGRHFRNHPALFGWDVWNELRWDVQCEDLVCFCPHTIAAWHEFLKRQFGSLEGLNQAWKRRYVCWEDVTPGTLRKDRVYTENMSWQHFITDRANRHGVERGAAMRAVDDLHPVTVHGDSPSAIFECDERHTACSRGNEWGMVDGLDGIGTSSFPLWKGIDDADFGTRIEMVSSCAGEKQLWLSELQGGRAATGFTLHLPVPGAVQQHWLWTGVGCGADAVLFWCWRDEVFGRESGGFGLAGRDGLAQERLSAMADSARILHEHAELWRNYRPEIADVAILYNPRDHYLEWAQENHADRMQSSILGYSRVFVRNAISPRFLEADHLSDELLARFRLLVLPHTLVLSDAVCRTLLRYVENGGTMLCESECGVFSPEGFYREPDRNFLNAAGITEIGRRSPLDNPLRVEYGGGTYDIRTRQWTTPVQLPPHAVVHAVHPSERTPLVATVPFGKGRILYVGTYVGQEGAGDDPELEGLMANVVRQAGCRRSIRVLSPAPSKEGFIYFRSGMSGDTRVIIVFFPAHAESAELSVTGISQRRFRELYGDREISAVEKPDGNWQLSVKPGKYGLAILVSI